jgi:alanyl-tRNA synthetase
MTTRLYYDDSLLLEFDATVTGAREHDGRPAVTLDRTAFYPSSGGQPFDIGTLGDAAVVDVVDDEDTGEILHVLDRPLAAGAAVKGTIDRARRIDHMQQHTGQHILSAVFESLQHAKTVSFHLGAEASTIDLDREVGAAAVAAVERRANEIVWDNRPVAVRYASEAEAAALPLRKESARTGTLRLVEVPDCDLSACGGTHVPATGAIGIIAVTGTERFKGGLRVSFVCGARALARFSHLRTAIDESIKRLSVLPAELPAAIARLQDENKAQRLAMRAQQEKLAQSEAETLRGRGEQVGGVTLVAAHMPGWDAPGIKLLASILTQTSGTVVALAGDGSPAPVVVARSDDGALDSGSVLRQAIEELGGKGGGKPGMAQGAVSAAPERAAEALGSRARAALA